MTDLDGIDRVLEQRLHTCKLSEAERGFAAWSKLNFGEKVGQEIERMLDTKLPCFLSVSMTEEHRIRQEARTRGVCLPVTPQADMRVRGVG